MAVLDITVFQEIELVPYKETPMDFGHGRKEAETWM